MNAINRNSVLNFATKSDHGRSHLLRVVAVAAAMLVLVVAGPGEARAQTSFYAGKTITVYCGYTPGGSYDLYARMMARTSASIFLAIPRSSSTTCRGPAASRRLITFI